ncbi:hypothetical protein scyTo_0005129 [Scyliorhinus torazame]|uniref:Integrator complex subunit 1 RPB2-binding domain-containing protein n=1 Tax=Scyliorhinus torazame TaxID=75743 RepID=A0A401P2T4_SCYTO|nr:hypothetical protein [Scyliorhinus torazame]
MNRPKAVAIRRPSSAKPSGHPPPGDFIALGSKGQASDAKASGTLLKPAQTGLQSDRKREGSSTIASTSGLSKRPKISSTPPLSALGRLAEAAVAEKRAISPSIKEPSVIPIEVPPATLLDEIEAAEMDGNDDCIEGLLCGAVKQMKLNRVKPDTTLFLSLMYLAKIKPNIFATEGVIEVYIEDSLGERIWVDSPQCKTLVENIQTAFGTKMPPKSMLLQADGGKIGSDLSAGGSPHPSTPDDDDNQTELLIAEEKPSPEVESGQVMPRYEDLAESVEDYIIDMLRDQLNRRQPMDNVSRNLLRLLTTTCGYKEVRLMTVQRLEMWLQNPKVGGH